LKPKKQPKNSGKRIEKEEASNGTINDTLGWEYRTLKNDSLLHLASYTPRQIQFVAEYNKEKEKWIKIEMEKKKQHTK
jgi:hypothetical protein